MRTGVLISNAQFKAAGPELHVVYRSNLSGVRLSGILLAAASQGPRQHFPVDLSGCALSRTSSPVAPILHSPAKGQGNVSHWENSSQHSIWRLFSGN